MFKESKGLEYTIEVLNVLSSGQTIDARGISHILNKERGMQSSPTYLSKMLRRMVKIGLLSSSDKGYKSLVDINTVSIGKILEFCEDPFELNTTILGLTKAVIDGMDSIMLSTIYNNVNNGNNDGEQEEHR